MITMKMEGIVGSYMKVVSQRWHSIKIKILNKDNLFRKRKNLVIKIVLIQNSLLTIRRKSSKKLIALEGCLVTPSLSVLMSQLSFQYLPSLSETAIMMSTINTFGLLSSSAAKLYQSLLLTF